MLPLPLQGCREVTGSLEGSGQGGDRRRAVTEEAACRPADLRGSNLRESAACGQRSAGKEEVAAAQPWVVPLPPRLATRVHSLQLKAR